MAIANNALLMQLIDDVKNGRAPGVPPPAPSAPIPYAPTTGMDSLRDDTTAAFGALNPEPVPPKFVSPAGPDMNFVNQYAGPEPTRPTLREPGLLEKIGTVLSGVGAGFEGRGGEYAESVRRQRNAPLVQYERDRERFEDRRTRAIELAERAEERRAEQAFRALEATYERDYRTWLSKNSDRSDEAKQRVAQAFTLERDARAARLEAEREQRRERREQEREARQTSDQYFGITKNKTLSDEIGRYKAGLTGSLSPAAAALDRRVTQLGEVGMGRAISGGGSGSGRARKGPTDEAQAALDRFNQARQALITALQQGNGKAADAYRQAMNRAFKSLARFPRDVEMFSQDPNWPFAQMRGQQSAPAAPGQQPQGKTISRAEMQALGVTEAQARSEGYTITP